MESNVAAAAAATTTTKIIKISTIDIDNESMIVREEGDLLKPANLKLRHKLAQMMHGISASIGRSLTPVPPSQ